MRRDTVFESIEVGLNGSELYLMFLGTLFKKIGVVDTLSTR
jgi:hypothetical protein